MSNKKSDEELNQETLKLVGILISGGVHKVPSVKKQPEVTLIRWQVTRFKEGDCLVGYHVEWAEGRVSTPVVNFDPKTRQCMTASGRRYQLVGEPGFDPDGNYVFNQAYSGAETKDVTNEYWVAIQSAARENDHEE